MLKASEVKAWTPDLYQELAARTMPQADIPALSMLHGTLGLVSEIDEYHLAVMACNDTKNYEDFATAKEHVKRELGDIWWMVAEIATTYKLKLSDLLNLPAEILSGDGQQPGFIHASAAICGMVQKTFQGHEIDLEKLKAELCRILFSLVVRSAEFGGEAEVWKTNIEKLEKRFPDGFEVERSLHREEGDI